MTHRERWLAALHFEPVDHIPDEEFGFWDETFPTWHEQGLPEEINSNSNCDPFFGFAPRAGVPVSLGLIPAFEYQVLEETAEHRIIRDGDGVKKMVPKDGHDTIPRYLEWPLSDRASWDEFRQRLDPHDPQRYPDAWDEQVERLNASDAPVVVGCGSLFGWLRDWAGFEGISIMAMDDPVLVEDMIEYLCWFICETLQRAVRDVRIDAGAFWEDMCFNHGCIISPKLFRQWLTPRYKRITDLVRQAGADIFYVDCDGNIMDVVEHWLAGGVNAMFPVEVAAGSDPHAICKRFGKDVKMLGGVNKRQLAAGRDAIVREVDGLAYVVEEGGFIPHCDHRCPPDVPYEDYLFYLTYKREKFGIPQPEGWKERVLAPARAAGADI